MGRTIKIQLSDEQRAALEQTYRSGANHALRIRCQMILLKSEGRKSQEIADFLGCCQQAVNNWLHRYKTGGIESLKTTVGGGRPPILSSKSDLAAVRAAVENHRQRIGTAQAELEETLGKRFCERTLVRFLKNLMPVTSGFGGDPKGVENKDIYQLKVEMLGELETLAQEHLIVFVLRGRVTGVNRAVHSLRLAIPRAKRFSVRQSAAAESIVLPF